MVAHRKGRQHQGGIAARPGATALCASTGSAQVDDADSAPLPPEPSFEMNKHSRRSAASMRTTGLLSKLQRDLRFGAQDVGWLGA
jgi:hypothetical protein